MLSQCIVIVYPLSLISRHSPLRPMLFLSLFPTSWCFRSSFLFLCNWISVVFFSYDGSICTHSLDSLYFTLGEFQAWDWLRYPLNCGSRGVVGVRMEQKSRTKFLPWPVFEPRTSRLAVQQVTARPLHAMYTVHYRYYGNCILAPLQDYLPRSAPSPSPGMHKSLRLDNNRATQRR